MALLEATIAIVEQVQVLDQAVPGPAFARPLAQQLAHLLERGAIGLAAFEAALALDATAQVLDAGHGNRGHATARRRGVHGSILGAGRRIALTGVKT